MGDSRGLTLIETILALALTSLVITGGVGLVVTFIVVPDEGVPRLVVEQELRNAATLLRQDGNDAQSFVAEPSPDYGTFRWLDFATFPPTRHSARYFWDDGILYRQAAIEGASEARIALVTHIADPGDVVLALGEQPHALNPERFGPGSPLVESLRDVLRRIESASRHGEEGELVRMLSVVFAAELRASLQSLRLGDGGESLQGIGIGPRLLDDIRFGVARSDVVVLVQDVDTEHHRIWRFVWTGFDFVLDAMEFHPWISSQATLRALAVKRLATRSG